jgi:S-DNA-T family DNA segregation ATPase FtsK/SpoIIIE
VLTDEPGLTAWDWVKWLPHNFHPRADDPAGPLRLVATDHDELFALLGGDFEERPEHDRSAVPGVAEPFVVVIAHRTLIPVSSRLLGGGLRNAVLLDLTGAMTGGPKALRLTIRDARVEYPTGGATASAAADALELGAAERLARLIAPMRTTGAVDLTDKPLETDLELTTLLGIRNPRGFDVAAKWRPRNAQHARLQVPIGVTEHGEAVELNLNLNPPIRCWV